jgi:vanillate O-demethylase ferredoxin subunit
MLAAFESANANWPREQIHVEYFTSKAEPAKTGDFPVELASSKQEFFIAKGKTILDVLLNAGVNVAYSCDAGICGACEQRCSTVSRNTEIQSSLSTTSRK